MLAFTGASGSLRGKANYASFAVAKARLQALTPRTTIVTGGTTSSPYRNPAPAPGIIELMRYSTCS